MSDKVSVLRGPKDAVVKTRNVTRTMTTGTALCTLPKGARILGLVLSGTASNAGTTATLSFGTTLASANEYVNAVNVLAAGVGNGVNLLSGVAGAVGGVLANDTVIFAKYAETGTASGAGAWKVHVVYTVGNSINDTTI
jgi:hypothetical protein